LNTRIALISQAVSGLQSSNPVMRNALRLLPREQIFDALRIEESQADPLELDGLQGRNSLADSGRDSAKPFLDQAEQQLHLAFHTALADRRPNHVVIHDVF
jgi:hypothetical protein